MRVTLLLVLIGGLCLETLAGNNQAVKPTIPSGAGSAQSLTPAQEELIGQLPQSDLVAILDLKRLTTDLMPRVEALKIESITRMVKSLKLIAGNAGVDAGKLQSVVVALSLQGMQASGVIVVQGVTLDQSAIELLLKAQKVDYRVTDYKGVNLLSLSKAVKSSDLGPLTANTEDLTVAISGTQQIALGNVDVVKSLIDRKQGLARAGLSKTLAPGVAPLLIDGLHEIGSNGLLRFALTLPADLREGALNQGDLFKSIGSIRMMMGQIDVTPDLDIALDSTLRTPAPRDAGELESGLKGLLTLVRTIFGSDPNSPTGKMVGQLVDRVRIASKGNDVSLALSLPRTIFEKK